MADLATKAITNAVPLTRCPQPPGFGWTIIGHAVLEPHGYHGLIIQSGESRRVVFWNKRRSEFMTVPLGPQNTLL